MGIYLPARGPETGGEPATDGRLFYKACTCRVVPGELWVREGTVHVRTCTGTRHRQTFSRVIRDADTADEVRKAMTAMGH
jgi:hypothetical protein